MYKKRQVTLRYNYFDKYKQKRIEEKKYFSNFEEACIYAKERMSIDSSLFYTVNDVDIDIVSRFDLIDLEK
jgi:hypothetical protein